MESKPLGKKSGSFVVGKGGQEKNRLWEAEGAKAEGKLSSHTDAKAVL